jgi:DNA-binding CsgD family transcriptional regulator
MEKMNFSKANNHFFIFDQNGVVSIFCDRYLEKLIIRTPSNHRIGGIFANLNLQLYSENGGAFKFNSDNCNPTAIHNALIKDNMTGQSLPLTFTGVKLFCFNAVEFLFLGVRQDSRNISQKYIKVTPLSPREHEVMHLCIKGQPSKVIAKELGLSLNTINNHFSSIFRKLKARSREEAIYLYIQKNIKANNLDFFNIFEI